MDGGQYSVNARSARTMVTKLVQLSPAYIIGMAYMSEYGHSSKC